MWSFELQKENCKLPSLDECSDPCPWLLWGLSTMDPRVTKALSGKTAENQQYHISDPYLQLILSWENLIVPSLDKDPVGWTCLSIGSLPACKTLSDDNVIFQSSCMYKIQVLWKVMALDETTGEILVMLACKHGKFQNMHGYFKLFTKDHASSPVITHWWSSSCFENDGTP